MCQISPNKNRNCAIYISDGVRAGWNGHNLILKHVCNCSPTRTGIDGYVADLAIDQNMIALEKFSDAEKKFFQSDGGQKAERSDGESPHYVGLRRHYHDKGS
jgi:hypothetical protein